MPSLIRFFDGGIGRLLRILLGVAVIWYGLFALGGTSGAILALIGLVPIGLGVWGHCLLELAAPRSARAA